MRRGRPPRRRRRPDARVRGRDRDRPALAGRPRPRSPRPRAGLDEMHQAGIRGVRVNLETAGETDPDAARRNLAAAVERVAPLGWHVQVYTRLSVITGLREEVARLPVPIVFDHFGGAQAAGGIDQPGFAALLALVGAGHAYVKVSAAYRSSEKAPAYGDVAPLAKALITANPERIVWGTDWPHPHAAAAGAALDAPEA